MLTGGLVAGGSGGAGEGGVDAVEELLARRTAEVERTRLHKVLEHALVDGAAVDALRKIGEVGVGSVLLAFLKDLLRGELAHALHAREAEADFRADRREHPP